MFKRLKQLVGIEAKSEIKTATDNAIIGNGNITTTINHKYINSKDDNKTYIKKDLGSCQVLIDNYSVVCCPSCYKPLTKSTIGSLGMIIYSPKYDKCSCGQLFPW
jgi:hypothetical protein